MKKTRRTDTLNQQIDENIRRVYSELAQEPVPDRFSKLLKQLRDKKEEHGGKKSEDQK